MTSQTFPAGITGFGGGASGLPFLEQLRAETVQLTLQPLPMPHVPEQKIQKSIINS